MRKLLPVSLASLLFSSLSLVPLNARTDRAPDPARDMALALTGEWAGYLEYRDYSEPPTSTKRVQLPMWLTVRSNAAGLSFHYIYDDGPPRLWTRPIL
jgi:hypothetical protein